MINAKMTGKEMKHVYPYTLILIAVLCSLHTSALHGMSYTTVSDTTRSDCSNAATNYSTWINTKQLENQSKGDSIAIVPRPPVNYTFSGPCADTIALQFEYYDASGTPVAVDTFVFIAADDTAPLIDSDFGDSLNLSCTDPIPDTSTVRITDNCDLQDVAFTEQIQGSGNCPYSQRITRTWVATDRCGNQSTFRQVIIINDDAFPALLDFPSDTIVDCNSSTDTVALGAPRPRDNCDPNPELKFNDQLIADPDTNCLDNYQIRRTWTAEDACGNVTFKTQIITVRDTEAPSFQVPADTVVSCTIGDDPSFTGRPIAVMDNCDSIAPDQINFQDIIVADSCANDYTVLRTWQVRDRCGNVNTQQQRIQVVDQEPPLFTRAASSLILNCDTLSVALQQYEKWIQEHGGARAADNCSGDSIHWQAIDTSTALPVTTPTLSCFDGDSTLLQQTVWFIASDACGNQDSSLAIFRVIDVQPPRLQSCPRDTILAAESRRCAASFTLPTPGVIDACQASDSLSQNVLLRWEYQVDQGPRILVNDFQDQVLEFPVGTRQIKYYVRDCGGNLDSCQFTVTIEDREAPVIECPADTTVSLLTGTCQRNLTLPMPVRATDNCTAGPQYIQTQPSDSLNGRLQFRYDATTDLYLAESRSYQFNNVAADAIAPVQLRVQLQADLSAMEAGWTILGESQQPLLLLDTGDASCSGFSTYSISIPADTFNLWARDGILDLRVEATAGQQPPVACDTTDLPGGATSDGNSALYLTLQYERVAFDYYVEGATQIPVTSTQTPEVRPELTFNPGESRVFYLLRDAAGNADTCSFLVTVRDDEAPVARCQATTLFTNPSGLENETVGVEMVDAGSSDNCSIDSIFITPNTFTCAQAGTVQDITLTVIDPAGNSATCSTIVRIENLLPEPTANSGLCGNDTLFLQANPPAAEGGIVYTYDWTGPNGFRSTRQNPVIPNISARNAGSYAVEITGITGCTATGIVEVSIEDLPLTPSVETAASYCVDEDIILESSVAPDGAQVIYRWYQGNPPSGILIGQTVVPTLRIDAPHNQGERDYYLAIESDGCLSKPSSPVQVRVGQQPVAIPQDSLITVCEGSTFNLGTQLSGPDISYSWQGPNGYSSTSQFPASIEAGMDDEGVYSLTVLRNGCASKPAFVNVDILPRPSRPELTNSGPVCEGEDLLLSSPAQATTYRWISPGLQEFPTESNTLRIPDISNQQEGNWRLRITNFGCESELSAPSNVVVNDLPRPAASAAPDVVCTGSTMELTASPDIINATYQWSGPNGFIAAGKNVQVSNMQPSKSGDYQLTITSPEGCAQSTAVNVQVQEGVRVVAVSNTGPRCLLGPTDIQLTATVFPGDPGNYNYEWSGPNGFSSTASNAVIPDATSMDNGNYQLRVFNAQGCQSNVGSTIVDVNDPPATPSMPTISSGGTAPFCVGDDLTLAADAYNGNNVRYNWITPNNGVVVTDRPSFSINGLTSDDAGNYAVFVSIDGCNSRQSGELQIPVNNKPGATATSNSPVCEGEQIQLQANLIAGASYSWTGPDFTSTRANPTIAMADSAQNAGTYELIVTLNGCASSIASTVVNIAPAPRQPVLQSNGPICVSADDAVLRLFLTEESTDPNASYIWTGPGGILDTTQLPALSISDFGNLPDGTYDFSVRGQLQACPSQAADPLRVELNRVPDNAAFAGADFAACETEEISLRAEPPSAGTGRWSLLGADTVGDVRIINPSQAQTLVMGLEGNSSYQFQWTLSNGACRDYDSDVVEVSVNESVEVEAGPKITACASRDIQLNATPISSGTGSWTQSESQELLGITIVEPGNPNTSVTGMQPGNLYSFRWTVTGGCGTQSDEAFVLISDPNPFAGPDMTVCNDDNFAILEAGAPTDGSVGRWSSPDPDITFTRSTDPSSIANNLQVGQNLLIWEVDNGICGADSRDTAIVRFKENPIAFPDDYDIEFAEPTIIDPMQNDSFPENTSISIVQPPGFGQVAVLADGTLEYTPSPTFVGEDRLFYELCSENCACALGRIEFTVGEDAECTIPNIITPNGDGVNDSFIVPCLLDDQRYPESRVTIFNRYGDEVFRSAQPYDNRWDGRYNGEELPIGTYFYIVEFGGDTQPREGFLLIQR